jgi:hypothetical protein
MITFLQGLIWTIWIIAALKVLITKNKWFWTGMFISYSFIAVAMLLTLNF